MRRMFHLEDTRPPAGHQRDQQPGHETGPWSALPDADSDTASATDTLDEAHPSDQHTTRPATTARVHLRALRRSPLRRSVGYAGGGLILVSAVVAAGIAAGTPHRQPTAAVDGDNTPTDPTEPPVNLTSPATPTPATPPAATKPVAPSSTPQPAAPPPAQPTTTAPPAAPDPQPPNPPRPVSPPPPPSRPAPPRDTTPPPAAAAVDPQHAARHAEAAVHADTALREAQAAERGAGSGGTNPATTTHLHNATRALDTARSLLGDDPDDPTGAVIAKADAVLATARHKTAGAQADATPAADDDPSANRGHPAHTQSTDDPPLARGTTNDRVRSAQHLLRSHGAPVPVTGQFDAQTDIAVRAFQQAHQLPTTGVIDATTWAALRTNPPPARQPDIQSPPPPQRSLLAPQPAPTPPPAPLPPAPPPPAPPPDPAPPVRNYYTVVRGDTLSTIEVKTGVTVATLKQLNGLTDSTILVGEQLRLNNQVPNKIHRKPATRATPPPPQPPPAPKEMHEAPMSECAAAPLPLPVSGPCYSNR